MITEIPPKPKSADISNSFGNAVFTAESREIPPVISIRPHKKAFAPSGDAPNFVNMRHSGLNMPTAHNSETRMLKNTIYPHT